MSSALGDVGGMYEDNLYLSNLYEFLDTPTMRPAGTATEGTKPGDGVRFEACRSRIPARDEPALDGIDLHIPPGSKLAIVGENGSGKTTLIKLLTRLYEPTAGRITLDGRDLREWSPRALHRRIGVIFQDFVRYQLTVGENIGAGDDRAYDDRDALGRRRRARPREADHRDAARSATTRSSAGGSRTAASSRSVSGRRSRSRARSCAAMPTSSCSTSRPRRWTPRPRSRSSSASAS